MSRDPDKKGRRGRATVSFNSGGGLSKGGTWDVKVGFIASRSALSELGFNKKDGSMPLPIIGSTDKYRLSPGESLNLLLEVKSVSPNNSASDLVGYISKGLTQAIQNAVRNPSKDNETNISVLLTDEQSYKKAYEANPDLIGKLYDKLKEAGGKVLLIDGLFRRTVEDTKQILNDVKEGTTPEARKDGTN